MDFNVGTFEACFSKIPWWWLWRCHKTTLMLFKQNWFQPPLWFSYNVNLVLFVAIIGSSYALISLLKEDMFSFAILSQWSRFVKLTSSWCIWIHSQTTNMNISKFFVTLWTIIPPPSPKTRLLTSTIIQIFYLFVWLFTPIKLKFFI
jgi:hypothetical protein